MDPGKPIRVFIAIQPPPEWAEEFRRVQPLLKRALTYSDVKWVEPERVHITLRFLGNIRPEQVPNLAESLRTAAEESGSFRLALGSLGCFPSMQRARVLWLGVEGAEEELLRLQERVCALTVGIGQQPEARAFQPHLTLGRIKHLDQRDGVRLETMIGRTETGPGEWCVSELLLMQSSLSSEGARYEILHRSTLPTK